LVWVAFKEGEFLKALVYRIKKIVGQEEKSGFKSQNSNFKGCS
jgi:hypothetical protein